MIKNYFKLFRVPQWIKNFFVFVPLVLGWAYPNIFSPVHVIFLELIMGPTCSIIYENEPMERNTMQQPPRKMSSTFLTWKEMRISILQGIIISAGVLFIYQYAVQNGASESLTRSMVFSTLVIANIFLSHTSSQNNLSLSHHASFQIRQKQ